MSVSKTPKITFKFLLFNCLAFSALALVNLITRLNFKLDTLEIAIVAAVGFVLVNLVIVLLLREFMHRFAWHQKPLQKTWYKLLIITIALGFLSSLSIVLFISFYYIVAGYASTLVFFMGSVYNNWFIETIIIALWSCVYLLVTNTKLLNDKNTALSLELKNAQLSTLNNQLNPHFLFNGLNNIRSLILEDVEQSRTAITNLSELLRFSLMSDKRNFCLLSEELNIVDCYVEIISLQYEKRLNFKKQIDAQDDQIIPPLVIQILIENAIKHGIDKIPLGGTISLEVSEDANFLRIIVINPGQLIDPELSTGIGIKNIRQRLFLLYDAKANFNIRSEDHKVISEIILPISDN